MSHGFFKKNDASCVVHMPVVGAVPLYLSEFGEKVRFSFIPILEPTFKGICDDFDRFEDFLRSFHLKLGFRFIESGLNVAFDQKSLSEYREATKSDDDLKSYIECTAYVADMYANMDW
jgi:hypothetical protein